MFEKKKFQKFIPGRDFLHHVWVTSKVEELYSALRNKTLKNYNYEKCTLGWIFLKNEVYIWILLVTQVVGKVPAPNIL